MYYFGQRHDAPIYEVAERLEAPRDAICVWCDEPILPNEDGFVDELGQALHRECLVRVVFGSASHQTHTCSCYVDGALDCDREENLSRRDSARVAFAVY